VIRFWLKSALPLIVIFAFPIFVIRAQPYQDRVLPALVHADCAMPCFMGIRPGVTSLDAAVYRLSSHEWSASSEADFPAQVRYAVMYNAVLPRTIMNWRWSETIPDWIDEKFIGSVMVEDRDVLHIMIYANLSLGEMLLAFGAPDDTFFLRMDGQHFGYSAWYASQGMLINGQGACPAQKLYQFPTFINFRSEFRGFPAEANSMGSVC